MQHRWAADASGGGQLRGVRVMAPHKWTPDYVAQVHRYHGATTVQFRERICSCCGKRVSFTATGRMRDSPVWWEECPSPTHGGDA